MSLIRPEVVASFARWREMGAAGGLAIVGVWLGFLGGWVLVPIGILMVVVALAWGTISYRRMRFAKAVSAPGVVETDEGQLGYFGPTFGGFIALNDLVELRLTQLHNTRQWRLKTISGEVLLIPTTASGAEKLFDAFAALPGIDMATVAAALDRGVTTLPLWQRKRLPQKNNLLNHELS